MNVKTPKLQNIFGERVRDRRLLLNLTQSDLAERTGIHRPDISDIEHGRHSPTLATVSKLAAALNTHPSNLVGNC